MGTNDTGKPMGFAFDKVPRDAVSGAAPAYVRVASVNLARRYLLIQNQHSVYMEIAFGTNSAVNPSGPSLRLQKITSGDYPIGSRWEASPQLGNLTRQAIWARSASAGPLLIIENSVALPPEPPAGASSSSSSNSSSSSSSTASSSSSSESSSSESSSSSSSPSSSSESSSSSTASSSSSSTEAQASSSSSSSTSSTSSYSSASESSSSQSI